MAARSDFARRRAVAHREPGVTMHKPSPWGLALGVLFLALGLPE